MRWYRDLLPSLPEELSGWLGLIVIPPALVPLPVRRCRLVYPLAIRYSAAEMKSFQVVVWLRLGAVGMPWRAMKATKRTRSAWVTGT